MKQKLLLVLICLLGISNIHAQFSAPTERSSRAKTNAVPVKIAGQQLRAATPGGLLYFGYCSDDVSIGVGDGVTVEMSAAICMPASLSGLYTGKKISKIRIGLTDNCTNVSVWIRNSLSGANVVSQTVGNASQGWTEVTLSTPFTIPAKDFYIGYTATGNFQIGFSGNTVYDGCWLQDDLYNIDWTNYSGSGWGSLCIQAAIDAQGATILAAKPESLPKSVQGNPNQNLSVTCAIKSYSSVDITSLKVAYQIDNQSPVEKVISTSIAAMSSGSINIPINAIASNGIYNLSVKILEINGQPNTFANESLNSQIRILSQSFPKKVVIEEGTGTWCGWCVRGAVGMAMMKQNHPNTFIGIAVHAGDEMAVSGYDNYMTMNFINGFPSVVVDRKADLVTDPYPDYGAEAAYQSEITMTPVAGIQLTGGFTDATKKVINLKTVTTFGISSGNANFKLAYVLVENGVTGYNQANYYSGGVDPMGGYENKPNPVTDMVFNDVARGIYSDPTGIDGSIPGSITAMTPVEHTYTINLPATIQDVNQLKVVVMLLNTNTGEIENADEIDVNVMSSNVPVTGVSLDQTTATLIVGDIVPLKAIVTPANATNQNVTWSSSNPAVVVVENSGLISAVGEGTAIITVTTEDGNKTATCTVTVNPAPTTIAVTGVSLNPTTATLIPGNTLQLTATITPADATNQNIRWNSSDELIATVSNTGLVTAIRKGITVITITTEEGEFTATCDVQVKSQTGIPELNAGTGAYLYNNRLYVKSPVAETIQIYSVNSVLLYNFWKPAGTADYILSKAPGSVLIVKGSSGWMKKVVIQ